ncbi:hypothetical protein WJX74_005608 [Apatococcus lobatus]|uniref:EF-hand domain-containing protein n=1 Tax=Apatococcus lobatus TaxID=904363 RepID=A0AAW1QU69_9CHLO
MTTLSPVELEQCKRAFSITDKEGVGYLKRKELRQLFSILNITIPSEELHLLISQADFHDFLKIYQKFRTDTAKTTSDRDTKEAFVALGGNADASGTISADRLRKTLKGFELTLDLESPLAKLDKEQTGILTYQQFKALMTV